MTLAPPRLRPAWAWAMAVGALSLAVLAHNLPAEPEFVDEWAYVSQAFYLDLLSQPDHPLWLDYPALDLPPLPKYLIGFSLHVTGHRLPPPAAAAAWYRDTSSRSGDRALLVAARWPSVVCGAVGCMAIFAIGTLARGIPLGLVASALLLANPLYRMLSRRAMADAPTEALVLVTAAIGLWAWKRLLNGQWSRGKALLVLTLAGVPAGLAVLSKLNGGLGLMTLGAWAILGLIVPTGAILQRWTLPGGVFLAGIVAFGVFVVGNPLLTASPARVPAAVRPLAEAGLIGRTRAVIEHRLSVPRGQQELFPHNALKTLSDKVAVVAVQGFGRFGPLGRKRFDEGKQVWWFDSTRRYDWQQDAGALLWLPVVVSGLMTMGMGGRRQRRRAEAPTSWALLVQALLAMAVVTAMLPMAWDRYFLGLQPGASLAGASAMVAALEWVCRWRCCRSKDADS